MKVLSLSDIGCNHLGIRLLSIRSGSYKTNNIYVEKETELYTGE